MDCSSTQPSETPNGAERPELSKEQEAAVFQAACRLVTAAVRRTRTESCRAMLGDAADTPVYGAFVTLRREGRLRACCGCIQSSMPLDEALDMAAQRAATSDPRFPPITSAELPQLHVDVWILWGPQPVAERGEDRVRAVTIGKHGLQIACGGARGLLLPGVAVEHGFDARTFLEQVCLKAGLPTDAWLDDDTTLMVFEGNAIEGPMQLEVQETRPPAVAGGFYIEETRPPAVAGGFYPADPREVRRTVEQLFAAAEKIYPLPLGEGQPDALTLALSQGERGQENTLSQRERGQKSWTGALVPHAGWVYSGRLAAAVLRRIEIPECVIVLCPKHRPGGAAWAVAPHRRWLFPGGELSSDPDLAARLAEGIPGLELDAESHRQEHAIEVQLPLLAYRNPAVRVVGIIVGDSPLAELLRFGVAMSVVLRDMPRRPLLLISSDMNHFADDVRTRRLDRLALDAIATLDPEQVYDVVRRNRISVCGAAPCIAAMEALRWLDGLHRCEEVGYATSAEAGGDTDRVVGYAGLLFG